MYWGIGSIAPRILNLGTRWMWVVSFRLRPHYPRGNNSRLPLDRMLGGPQGRSGCSGEEKFSHPLPESKPRSPSP